ncbi:MAG: helix-turn-helix domain-containing protein [Alphaproteobacteria bacterium]
MHLSPEKLRAARKQKGLTLKQIAGAMEVSIPQVQRLENGQRRMTLDALEAYCQAVGIDLIDLIREPVMVPIIGIINENAEVLPLTPNTPYETRAPYIVPDPERLSAIRWEPRSRIVRMSGHLAFFYSDIEGVPEHAWAQRCMIRRGNGTERMGWPVREGGQTHIDDFNGPPEFNVEIASASPILAVIPPFLLDR